MVYTRSVGQRTINLAVSGMLWSRSLVMIDEETESLWSHMLGRAMQGPLEGAQLEALPAEMVTWRIWRREHPQTTVLNLSRTAREYIKEFYRRPADFVFGWIDNGRAYSAGFDELIRNPVRNLKPEKSATVVTFDKDSTAVHRYSGVVDERVLHFEATTQTGRMKDSQTGTVWNGNTGVAVEGPLKGTRLKQQVGIVSYARAWKIFHPESRSVHPPGITVSHEVPQLTSESHDRESQPSSAR